VLAEAKITNDAIAIRMEESKATEYIIDKTRETFRVVAYRASILFFSIVDLAVINSMYQYSLQWFSNLFGSSVNDSPKAPDNSDQRILNLNNHFTLNLYENVCRSLFEKDKLLFSFKLTVNILGGDGKMDQDEMRFFLAGPSGDIPIPPNPTKWLGDLDFAETYKQIYKMNQILPAFAGLEEFFMKNHLEFEKIYDSETPENQPLPGEWNKKLNSFQKMIVLKSLRPDKITLAI
jgi:dynein heavy chain